MILIVDSGATKSDWIALDNNGDQLFLTQTLGLSPEVLTREVIEDRLANNFELCSTDSLFLESSKLLRTVWPITLNSPRTKNQ